MTTQMKAKIIRIRIEPGDADLLFATSPDIKGLLVAENNAEALEREIPKAIRDMYAVSGVDVVVSPVEDDGGDEDNSQPWVAMPADLARAALG